MPDTLPPEDPPADVAPAEVSPADPAPADLPADADEELIIVAPRPITAASSLAADARDIRMRPLTRPGDLIELMPGAFAVQHAGGGKANQYFVRGFDIDHGTDLAIDVAGIPANLVSHAHGQGYTDLNFVVPEFVDRVDVRKGPYEVFDGDLTTAGTVKMSLTTRVDAPRVQATYGSFDTWRALALGGVTRGRTDLVGGAEVYGTNGPFDNPQGFIRYNGYGAVTTTPTDGLTLGLGGTVYGGSWSASGQIPLRGVESGQITPFGSVDPTEGGQSWRRQLWATVDYTHGRHAARARVWYGGYALNLFSNFTFFATDPVHGDQIEQQDRRQLAGYDVSYATSADAGPVRFATSAGAQGRYDDITTGLYTTEARERRSTAVDSAIDQTRNGLWLREEVSFDRWVRLVGGVRYDLFQFGVNDALDTPGDGDNRSGVAHAGVFSPKVNLIVTPTPWLDLFGNYGRGFHSNDARGVVRSVDPADAVTVADGFEGGVRLHLPRWGQVALSGWGLDLAQETVWVGDEGTTELRGATRRYGFEGSLRVTPLPWMQLDLDLTATKAAYVSNAGNGDAIALAPPLTLSGGVGVEHPIGLSASARVRHLAARPATEDRSLIADGWTILDLSVGYRWRFIELDLQLNNAANSAWREVQFANESQLPGEPAPVQDLHYTPGWPRTILGTVRFWPGARRAR